MPQAIPKPPQPRVPPPMPIIDSPMPRRRSWLGRKWRYFREEIGRFDPAKYLTAIIVGILAVLVALGIIARFLTAALRAM